MDSFNEVWEKVCEVCKNDMAEVAFDSWIATLEPVELNGNIAVISSKSEYQKNIVEKHYVSRLEGYFEEVFGFPITVSIITKEKAKKSREINLNEPIYKRYTFDNFIVGPSNDLAHAAALHVAKNPGKTHNPLFIYGNSGLGKTHLLNAIRNSIEENFPEMVIIYKQGEEFSNEIISAISYGSTQQFRDKYRKADVLIVDDIQFIAGKESTQIEFFNTFNALFNYSKQIILSSDRPPKEIHELDERLHNRFESGLLVDVQLPTFEMRVAILKRKAEYNEIEVPDIIITYIANQLKNNIRQLEGIINKITAYKSLTGQIVSLNDVTNLINELKKDEQPDPVSPDQIIAAVAAAFDVTPSDIISTKQNAEVATARHFAVYVIRKITNLPLKAIGDAVKRNHSTVCASLKKAEAEIKKNTYMRAKIEELIKNITA